MQILPSRNWFPNSSLTLLTASKRGGLANIPLARFFRQREVPKIQFLLQFLLQYFPLQLFFFEICEFPTHTAFSKAFWPQRCIFRVHFPRKNARRRGLTHRRLLCFPFYRRGCDTAGHLNQPGLTYLLCARGLSKAKGFIGILEVLGVGSFQGQRIWVSTLAASSISALAFSKRDKFCLHADAGVKADLC